MTRATLAAALAIALAAPPARAAPLRLVPAVSGYADAKGVALRAPEGVACADDGRVVVADTGNARLVSYTFKDGEMSPGVELKPPQLGYPIRVQLDAKGNELVLDRRSGKIVRVDPKGAFLGIIDVRDGTVEVHPVSFKVDGADTLYVLDGIRRNVLVMDAAGKVARRIDLPKSGVFTDVAVDAGGIVYAVDEVAAQIWSAGAGAPAFAPFTKSLKDYMSFPGYLATTPRGVMILVDQNGGGIVVVGSDGSYQGRQLSLGVSEGLLWYPSQLCVNRNGDTFIADRSNNRVQVFTAPQ